MITGASILFLGILIGYSIASWNQIPFYAKIQSGFKKLLSKKATVIDITPPVDLGDNE